MHDTPLRVRSDSLRVNDLHRSLHLDPILFRAIQFLESRVAICHLAFVLRLLLKNHFPPRLQQRRSQFCGDKKHFEAPKRNGVEREYFMAPAALPALVRHCFVYQFVRFVWRRWNAFAVRTAARDQARTQMKRQARLEKRTCANDVSRGECDVGRQETAGIVAYCRSLDTKAPAWV